MIKSVNLVSTAIGCFEVLECFRVGDQALIHDLELGTHTYNEYLEDLPNSKLSMFIYDGISLLIMDFC